MAIESRKQKRVVLKKYVTINNSLKAMGLDLSEGGLYVHAGRSFPPGMTVDVSLPLDTGVINVKCLVQHTQEGVGMGLMFAGLTKEDLAAIREFIRNAEENSEAPKRKVLLVDDNAANRKMNRSKLILDGFAVLEASDGVEAISVLEKENIDLVVLDLYMEKLDGFKVLSIMRESAKWKDIPVLVFSARSSPVDVDRAKRAGATEFLVKMTTTPVKLSELVKRHLPGK